MDLFWIHLPSEPKYRAVAGLKRFIIVITQ